MYYGFILLSFRYRNIYDSPYDIALVRIKGKPITFSDRVMPICLPPGPKYPDSKGEVFVAG